MEGRSKLLRMVQTYNFAALEAGLFLDTHPQNREAFEYFQKMNNAYRKLRDEFVHKYGPLQQTDELGVEWNWVDDPWPWELEAQ